MTQSFWSCLITYNKFEVHHVQRLPNQAHIDFYLAHV